MRGCVAEVGEDLWSLANMCRILSKILCILSKIRCILANQFCILANVVWALENGSGRLSNVESRLPNRFWTLVKMLVIRNWTLCTFARVLNDIRGCPRTFVRLQRTFVRLH